MAKLKIMERVFPRRRTPHEQKLRSFTSRIHQISNVHRDAMRCGSIRIRFDSRNCCPTRDSPSRLQYTASLTAELNIYNADSECQNCIDCTNWRTNLPHFSYLAARSDAMVPNRLVGIGIQCLPRMPAHGHTGAGRAGASIPLGVKGSVLDQSRYPARVDYPLQEYGSSRFMTGSRHPPPPPFASLSLAPAWAPVQCSYPMNLCGFRHCRSPREGPLPLPVTAPYVSTVAA